MKKTLTLPKNRTVQNPVKHVIKNMLAVFALLIVTTSCSDYGFDEIADDAAPRRVYYKAGDCNGTFTATLPTDNTEYTRLDTPALKGNPTCARVGTTKNFSYWKVTNSGNDGNYQPNAKISFSRHDKYVTATALWDCLVENYVDGGQTKYGTCKKTNDSYNLLPATTFAKEGHYFEQWKNTITNATLAVGAPLTAPANASTPMPTYKPVWKPAKITVKYVYTPADDPNSDSSFTSFAGTAPPSTSTPVDFATNITLHSGAETRCHRVIRWQVSSGDSFAAGNSFTVGTPAFSNQNPSTGAFKTADLVLKPVYAASNRLTRTVTLDANGGTLSGGGSSTTHNFSCGISTSSNPMGIPTKTGYIFNGWELSGGAASDVSIGTYASGNQLITVYKDVTLKAKWQATAATGVKISINGKDVSSNTIYVEQDNVVHFVATVEPSSLANKNVTWTSGCGTTGNTGTTYALKPSSPGTCTLTATSQVTSSITALVKVIASKYDIGNEMKPVPDSSSIISFPQQINDSGTGTIPENHKFAMGKTEVTYRLWRKVYDWAAVGNCQSNGQGCYTFAHAGKKGNAGTGSDKQPVTKISWYDAVVWSNAFTQWYNAVYNPSPQLTVVYKNGTQIAQNAGDTNNVNNSTPVTGATGFRLPTDWEWEFAARLRTNANNTVGNGKPSGVNYPISLNSKNYWFTKGNSASGAKASYTDATETKKVAWYSKNSSNKTHDVCTTSKNNSLEICDMSGNVFEWAYNQGCGTAAKRRVMSSAYSTSPGSGSGPAASRLQIGEQIGCSGKGDNNPDLGFRVVKNQQCGISR